MTASRAILIVLLTVLASLAAEQLELRGRVVCIPEEKKEPGLSKDHHHVYGFKTVEAKIYKLVRTRFSEALFMDQRLHEKDLLLKGKLDSDSFDVLTIRSIKNGIVHDLYYWCEICAIESVSPEICVCCQAPVELTEKPLAK